MRANHLLILLLCLLVPTTGSPFPGQSPGGPPVRLHPLALEGLEAVYNFELDRADSLFGQVGVRDSSSPAGPFFQGVVAGLRALFSLPEAPDQQAEAEMIRLLGEAQESARRLLGGPDRRAEALLYTGAALGVRGIYEGTEHNWLQAYWHGRQALGYVEQEIRLYPQFGDAYLGLGVYHYHAAVLPGVVKILARIGGLRGERQRGLQEIRRAQEEGTFTRTLAEITMIHVAAKYERPTAVHGELAERLATAYPGNPYLLWRSGDIARRLGWYGRAEVQYRRLLEGMDAGRPYFRNRLFSRSLVEYRLGQVLEAQSRSREALELFSELAEVNPEEPDWVQPWALVKAGDLARELGLLDQAARAYRDALALEDRQDSHKAARDGLRALNLKGRAGEKS